MLKSIFRRKSYFINSPSSVDLWKWLKKIWVSYRWEIAVIVSIIVFVACYLFSHQDKYNGIQYDLSKIQKKGKRVPKKHETECRRIVEDIFKIPFSAVRPNFLKNPKTGKNLELDMYNHNIKLAVEYQGAQHRTYTPFFHKSYGDFLGQVERDNYKKRRCSEEGIDLICVPDTIPYQELGQYITGELRRLKRIN